MSSTLEQMQENRDVLAAIAESQSTIAQVTPTARHEILALEQTARRMRRAIRDAAWFVLTVGIVGGLAGGAAGRLRRLSASLRPARASQERRDPAATPPEGNGTNRPRYRSLRRRLGP
jgi:hypothetical protein